MILKIREGLWFDLNLVEKFEWFEVSEGHKGNCYSEHFELWFGDNCEKVHEQNAIDNIFAYLGQPRRVEA